MAATRALRYSAFYVCLTLIAVVFVAPYVLAFFGAFKPASDLYTSSPWSPPHSFYTGNFTAILTSNDFIRYLGNTALVTAALTIGQVSFGILAAYAFARLEFPGRDGLFSIYLATLMVPNVVTIVPLYTMFREFHLTNTYWAIFLPYTLGVPYTIFLMRQYFKSLPGEVFGLIDSVNAHSPNQEAAWQLEQWLGSRQSEQILGSGGYIWPGIPTLDPLFATAWQAHSLNMTPFATESKWHVVYWPVTPGMNQAQLDIANQLAPAYLNGRNVAQAVAAAASQANSDLSSAG
jgi:hypothetical protein